MALATVDEATRQGVATYLAHAEALSRDEAPDWWQALRENGRHRFAQLGFPTSRDEEWKYTDTSAMAHLPQAVQSTLNGSAGPNGKADDISKYFNGSSTRLVFVNGRFAPELSSSEELPDGVIVRNLREARDMEAAQNHLARYAHQTNDDGFTALNTAMLDEGVFVHVAANVVLEAPIEVLYYSDGEQTFTSHPRTLVVVEQGAQITISETFAGRGTYFCNTVTEVVVGANARVDHYKVQQESEQGLHVGTLQVEAARDAEFRSHSLNLGGRVVRNNANARLGGENIHVTLNGLVLTRGHQLVDNHTAMDHAQPHCTSHERYAHILNGHSTAVFNGKIFVRIDAQKTDAVQSNRTLLLSPDAVINTKPQLEILADDVKCTHGATIGQLDEEALFYLRARGIDVAQAQALLTYAFAEEVLEGVRIEALKERMEQELLTRL